MKIFKCYDKSMLVVINKDQTATIVGMYDEIARYILNNNLTLIKEELSEGGTPIDHYIQKSNVEIILDDEYNDWLDSQKCEVCDFPNYKCICGTEG